MAINNSIVLYDLQLATGATISPFVWATKYALKHKGFDIEIVPGGFTGILERTGGRSERVPVIRDDDTWVLDSWGIVEYLDATYPDRPMLVNTATEANLIRFLDTWLWQTATGPWMGCYCADYRDLSMPQDHDYVTRSRENILGMKLEEMQAGRSERLPRISAALELLRKTLRTTRWLGGESPNYADYRALGSFLFTASIAKTPPLAADDPLRDWLDRSFDLYDGLGRHPGMYPLFGLEQRAGDPELFSRAGAWGGQEIRNTGPAATRAETEAINRSRRGSD